MTQIRLPFPRRETCTILVILIPLKNHIREKFSILKNRHLAQRSRKRL